MELSHGFFSLAGERRECGASAMAVPRPKPFPHLLGAACAVREWHTPSKCLAPRCAVPCGRLRKDSMAPGLQTHRWGIHPWLPAAASPVSEAAACGEPGPAYPALGSFRLRVGLYGGPSAWSSASFGPRPTLSFWAWSVLHGIGLQLLSRWTMAGVTLLGAKCLDGVQRLVSHLLMSVPSVAH